MAAEIYRPCAPETCPNLPSPLRPIEPPYPGVIVHHGGSSRKEYHWWSSQTLAEAGYLVVAVDSTSNGAAVLDWMLDPANPLTVDLDRNRIGIAGHSIGGQSAAGRQGDVRVSAIIIWDGVTITVEPGTSSDVSNDPAHVTPTLYLYSDGGFASPVPRTSVSGTPKSAGFAKLRARGADTMSVAERATTHLDFVGGELMGNRYAELRAAMGFFDGQDASAVCTDIRDTVRTAFRARNFRAEIFVVTGANWAGLQGRP